MRLILPPGDTTNRAGLLEDEQALQERAVGLCARFRRAVDIHGHIGARAILLADRFNHVESFEPQEDCHRCFQHNVRSPRVTLRRIGIHAQTGVGYVAMDAGKDSARTTVHLESLKRTVRVPVAAIDDFGWNDVDLIYISQSADWLDVLAGAFATIRRSRPVICVRPKGRSERETNILKKLAQLLAIGYRIEEIDDNGLILGAERAAMTAANAKTSVSLLFDDASNDQYLVAAGSSAEKPSPPRARHSVIGRTLLDTRSPHLALTSGPTRFHELTVVPPFKLDGYHALTLPGGSRIRFDTIDKQTFADIADRIGISLSAAGGIVTIPPALAAIASRVSIELRDDAGNVAPILSKTMGQLSPIDEFRFAWPLDLIRPGRRTVTLRLSRGETLLAEKSTPIDFALHHIDAETVNCYQNRGGGGIAAMQALAESLHCRTYYAEDGYVPGVSAVWGVLRGSKDVIDAAIARGSIFYYVDHAYFNRGHRTSYRITRDAFEAGPVRQCPDDRIAAHDVELHPWRESGKTIIVCPPTDYFKEAHNCHGWLDDTLAELRRHSDRPILIREKPATGTLEPLADALANAHALVTHSSNVAIEAAILGTPVFVSDRSAARPVGLSDLSQIESPVRPPREQWLAHLAYSQFSYEEMQTGEAWKLLQDFERFPLLETLSN